MGHDPCRAGRNAGPVRADRHGRPGGFPRGARRCRRARPRGRREPTGHPAGPGARPPDDPGRGRRAHLAHRGRLAPPGVAGGDVRGTHPRDGRGADPSPGARRDPARRARRRAELPRRADQPRHVPDRGCRRRRRGRGRDHRGRARRHRPRGGPARHGSLPQGIRQHRHRTEHHRRAHAAGLVLRASGGGALGVPDRLLRPVPAGRAAGGGVGAGACGRRRCGNGGDPARAPCGRGGLRDGESREVGRAARTGPGRRPHRVLARSRLPREIPHDH